MSFLAGACQATIDKSPCGGRSSKKCNCSHNIRDRFSSLALARCQGGPPWTRIRSAGCGTRGRGPSRVADVEDSSIDCNGLQRAWLRDGFRSLTAGSLGKPGYVYTSWHRSSMNLGGPKKKVFCQMWHSRGEFPDVTSSEWRQRKNLIAPIVSG